MKIEINNLTDAQAIAIEDMFATWQKIGNLGRNRFVGFYVCGEEGFHPEILINGNEIKTTSRFDNKHNWHSIKIKIAPTVENKLLETTWIDEADVYLIDPIEIQEAMMNIESENEEFDDLKERMK